MEGIEDVQSFNRYAWDRAVERKSRWTVPVSGETVAAARGGSWEIFLTPAKPVPRAWFPDFRGAEILCLAAGGGQQGPILAAAGESAGARVTVYDISPRQLAQDRLVAEREGLDLVTVEATWRTWGFFQTRSST